jgi:hypothetical protein
VEVAGAGGCAEEAGGGVTDLVGGRNNGPFCPQPASSPAPSNSDAATKRLGMRAIRSMESAASIRVGFAIETTAALPRPSSFGGE